MGHITLAEVFVTIVERGSLSAAAGALDMPYTVVTCYLTQMEAWSGARLLHRTMRRIGLTPTGEAALARYRQILEIASQIAVVDGPEADTPRGLLRIACAQSLAQQTLNAAVTAYLRRYPQTAVDLVVDNRTTNLAEERIGLAVRITNDLDPNLITQSLGMCESIVVAAPFYLAAHGTLHRMQNLTVHNCLTYTYLGKSLWKFTRAKTSAPSDVPISDNLSANESMVLLTAVREGADIVLQPVFAAVPLVASRQLVCLLPDYLSQALGIHGVYSSRRQMPAALRAMLDFLVDWFKAQPSIA